MIGRKKGLVASVSAGRIILTRASTALRTAHADATAGADAGYGVAIDFALPAEVAT